MPAPLLSTVLGGQGVLPARGMEEASPGPRQAANVPSWKPAERGPASALLPLSGAAPSAAQWGKSCFCFMAPSLNRDIPSLRMP